MGEEGFSSSSSLPYHAGDPSANNDSRVWHLPDSATAQNHLLRPRHQRMHDLCPDPWWKPSMRHRPSYGARQRRRARVGRHCAKVSADQQGSHCQSLTHRALVQPRPMVICDGWPFQR